MYPILIGVICLLLSQIHGTIGSVQIQVKRSVEGIKLRSIGQSMLSDEATHPGALTSGDLPDVYAVAARLARDGEMTDPSVWFSKIDQNYPAPREMPQSILDPVPAAGGVAPINPIFQGMTPAVAVALFPAGTNFDRLPGTTPLAWTRGLQPDGNWSKSLGTYGDWGGHIVFLNGSIQSLQGSISGKLTSYGNGKPTSNIQEALPPGTRISEFKPGK